MCLACVSGFYHPGLILDLLCDPGTRGFSAGLVFTEGGYHLLLQLFGLSHTKNVFEVVYSLKIKTRRNHRRKALQITTVYLGMVLPLCWQKFYFFSLEPIP